MKVINCTPHDINFVEKTKTQTYTLCITIPKSGIIPRLIETTTDNGSINFLGVDIPIINKKYHKCKDLPEKKKDTFLIVSGLVASSIHRDDLLVPNTVRDETGKIIGCDSFAQIL